MSDPAMLGTSGYARNADDAYWTPEWCTEELLEAVKFRGPVWEPASGKNHIVTILHAYEYETISTDIKNYGWQNETIDFLDPSKIHEPGFLYNSIITNPPYKHVEGFIRNALNATQKCKGQVAMLLRNEYDSASSRVDLFNQPPFYMKLVLTRRPRWSEQNTASPRHNFSWFIWDWQHTGPATLRYQEIEK
jgi:hypothetical protein